MLKTKLFPLFGKLYRTTQLSAFEALQEATPLEQLNRTEIAIIHAEQTGDTSMISRLFKTFGKDLAEPSKPVTSIEWVTLDTVQTINEHVFDAFNIVPPMIALNGLIEVVQSYNYGFLDGWRPVSVPPKFISTSYSVDSQAFSGLINSLIATEKATLNELQTIYSYEEAAKMMNIQTAKTVNEMYAQEAQK